MSQEKTNSGIFLKNTYGDEERPGVYPYTRGIHESMYQGKLWTMRQYAGFGSAEESNQRYHYLLKNGTMGLSVAFDLPTQLGYDPDHPRSQGEVGRVGVSISSLEDMRVLFQDIDLSKISTSMTINATANILLAFYAVLAEEKQNDWKQLRGTVQNDVLKEYCARGNYIYPPHPSMRLATDLFDWCSEKMPLWNPISISGYHIREAGSDAIQELAFTFLNARAYVDSALSRGMKVDDFAGRLSFFFNVHNDFFEEIAKFRAARRIWAKLMKNHYNAQKKSSLILRFHAQTAGSTLTAQQPKNNLMRVSYQALAAILGGAQSLHTNSYDEALGLPTEESAQMALRTQQILAHETGVSKVADPLGGSFFIESLTDEIETKVEKMIQEILKNETPLSAIESGRISSEIAKTAYQAQIRIESGEHKIIGMNFLTKNEKTKIEIQKLNSDSLKSCMDRLNSLKRKRSSSSHQAALQSLKDHAQGGSHLQDAILQAVRSGATLGEISNVFRDVFGEFHPRW